MFQNCMFSYCSFSQIEKAFEVWPFSFVHLANDSMTGNVFCFFSVQYLVLKVDTWYDHADRTCKTIWISVLGEKIWQSVRFWIENLTTPQNFGENYYNTSDFVLKIFWKKQLLNHFFLLRNQIFNWNLYIVSDFHTKISASVRFWIENFTTCQVLNLIFQKFCCTLEAFDEL